MTAIHPDTKRLAALDRRPDLDLEVLVDHWTEKTRTPGGEWRLRPLQALALEEAELVGGGLYPLGIGTGKSLLSLLLPIAMGVPASDCLLLLPASLVAEHHRERARYSQHFAVEEIPVLSYEMLSRPERFEELAARAPRAIIADEAHALRNRKAARTQRFLRYMSKEGKGCAFVAMSASLAATSLHDWAHLSHLALGDQTPLPLQWVRLDAWARTLDPEHPTPASARDHALFSIDLGAGRVLRTMRERRAAFLVHTDDVTGLVRSSESSTPAGLTMEVVDATTPALYDVIADVEATYVLPCGEEIEDPLRCADKVAQLASGFYYQADWDGSPPPREWFYARREWAAAMRRVAGRGQVGLDSPALVCEAARAGTLPADVCEKWAAWDAVSGQFSPKTRPVWVDEGPMVAAMEWAWSQPDCLVWYAYEAQAAWLAAHGFSVARPGERPTEKHTAVSLSSHKKGLNLQAWATNLYLSPSASAEVWEQSLGRTRRAGQTRDVWARVHAGAVGRSRVDKARERAAYIIETQRVAQSLVEAKWIFEGPMKKKG